MGCFNGYYHKPSSMALEIKLKLKFYEIIPMPPTSKFSIEKILGKVKLHLGCASGSARSLPSLRVVVRFQGWVGCSCRSVGTLPSPLMVVWFHGWVGCSRRFSRPLPSPLMVWGSMDRWMLTLMPKAPPSPLAVVGFHG